MVDIDNPLKSPVFQERSIFLKASQYWTKEQLDDWQLRQLVNIVRYAGKYVPFYSQFFDEHKIEWSSIKCLADIKRLPIIDKKIIQSRPIEFISERFQRTELISRTTGGSTGTPLTVWADQDFISKDKANTQHYMQIFGLDIFSFKSVRLYGDAIDSEKIKQGEYWRFENNKLVMSSFHINSNTIKSYVLMLKHHEPVYIHTRASAVLTFIRNAQLMRIQLPSVKYIFCDGEYLTVGQRKIIEQAFQGRVINIYGHTEGALVGHPCEYSDSLHFMPQVGILELLDENGKDVTAEGAKGEIVSTGFNNFAFPLIRYRTGDIAIKGSQLLCKCSRHYTLINEVEGRVQDYVVDKNKHLVPIAPAIFNYNDMDWEGITEFKVVQETVGELIFLLVYQGLNNTEVARMYEGKLEKILGINFKITIIFVDHLEKTKIGKYRYLEQKLDLRNIT